MSFGKLIATIEGIEGGENTIDQTTPTDVQIDEASIPSSASDTESELETEARDIDQIDTGIDSAEESLDTINEMKGELEASAEETGGASDTEVAIVTATHESIMNSLGLPIVVASMESVPYQSRRQVLIATLEDAGKGIFTKMGEAIKYALKMTLEFIQNVIKNTWVLEKYRKYVLAKAAKISGAPNETTMPASARAMSVNGVAGTASIEPMFNTAMSLLTAAEDCVDKINKLNFKASVSEDVVNGSGNVSINLGQIPVRGHTDGGNEVGFLTNDRSLVVPSNSFESKNMFFVPLPHTDPKREAKIAETADVATPDTIRKLLDNADKIIQGIKKVDSKRSIIKNAVSRVLQFIAEVGSTYGSVVSKAAKEQLNKLAMIRGVRTFLNRAISRYPLEAFKTAKAFIDYARNSISKYGNEGGPAKEEEDRGVEGSLNVDEVKDNPNAKAKQGPENFRFKGDTSRRFKNS